MSSPRTSLLPVLGFAVVHLAVWLGLGLWVIPRFTRVYADLLEGPALPSMTQWLLGAQLPGCLAFGLGGAAAVVGLGFLPNTRGLQRITMAGLCLALVGALAALLWPLVSLPGQAA